MKQLETTIRKNGFTYEQIERTDEKAIYRQLFEGHVIGHEIFFIHKRKEREIAGTVIPAHEGFPGDNDFGVTAWSVGMDLQIAIQKYNSLQKHRIGTLDDKAFDNLHEMSDGWG